MESFEKGFRIGEFARLAQVSKDTLFHYEKIGILTPEYVDQSNGYRYYSGAQFFHLEMIKALRESGLSLDEIIEFKRYYNPEWYLKVMKRQSLVLKEQIRKLEKLQKTLDNNIDMTERSLSKPLDMPVLRQEPETFLVVLNTEKPDEEQTADVSPENDSIAVSELIVYCAKHEIDVMQPVGTMIAYEDLIAGRLSEGNVFFPLSEQITDDHVIVKPAGTYLVMYHKGLYSGQTDAYRILFDYIQQHNLRIAGASYELEVCGYLTVGLPNEFIIRYAVQVEEK